MQERAVAAPATPFFPSWSVANHPYIGKIISAVVEIVSKRSGRDQGRMQDHRITAGGVTAAFPPVRSIKGKSQSSAALQANPDQYSLCHTYTLMYGASLARLMETADAIMKWV